MKIRMIFGTTVEIDGKLVDLKCDSTPDVQDEIAEPLVASGRAEPVTPPAAPKKSKA